MLMDAAAALCIAIVLGVMVAMGIYHSHSENSMADRKDIKKTGKMGEKE